MKKGIVYIITNPSFQNDWVKIGKTSRSAEERCKELDNTSTPLPFEIFAIMETEKFNDVESQIHSVLDNFMGKRIRRNREFFNITPEKALELFKTLAGTINDAVIKIYNKDSKNYEIAYSNEQSSVQKNSNVEDKNIEIRHTNEKAKKRNLYSHKRANVPNGAELIFKPDDDSDFEIKVKAVDDDEVEYDGMKYKLSAFCSKFMPEYKQNKSKAYQGCRYFEYRGQKLRDRMHWDNKENN